MKKYTLLLSSLLGGFLMVGVTSSFVYAIQDPNNPAPVQIMKKTEDMMKGNGDMKKVDSSVRLAIHQNGMVQFGGAKFMSLSGSNVNMTVSGLPVTLVTNSSTEVLGVSALSNIAVGDILSGKGTINQDTGVITVTSLRDESQQTQRVTDLENQIKALLEQIKKLQSEFKNIR